MSAPISSSRQHMAAHYTSTSSAASSTQQSPTNKIAPPPPAPYKAPSTDVFLKDFTLVAEAAKRAQMAVLMRDFEGCSFS